MKRDEDSVRLGEWGGKEESVKYGEIGKGWRE